MKIAIIVVNYGTADLAVEAVESVLAQSDTVSRCEVHLVDNASPGDDADRLRQAAAAKGWGPAVTLWPETTNHGFGRGNNLVLRALTARPAADRPDYVMLLNPDAALRGGALAHLAQALRDNPDIAAVGAAIVNAQGAPAASSFRFPTMIRELIRVIDFGPLKRALPHSQLSLPATLPRQEVDWVSGSAVMFRLTAIESVDFFDPGFFLYYEEVDLMRRLRASGWRVLHVPDAQVLHHAGAATGVRSEDNRRNPVYLYNSWARYFAKSIGRPRALGLAMLLMGAGVLNVALFALRGRRPSLPQKFFRDHMRHALLPLAFGGVR